MTPLPSSLHFGSNCPCGIGTVTGVDHERGVVTARTELAVWGAFVQHLEHRHTFAEVATMLRQAKWAGVDRKHWPHECVRCGAPAYVGAVPAAVDCSEGCR